MSEKTDSDRTLPEVRSAIRLIRKQRVLLDADLARFYGVTTKRLNEAVKRNRDRFPADFAFQLNEGEYASLRCAPAAGKAQHSENEPGVNMWAHLETTAGLGMRSQFATASAKRNNHFPSMSKKPAMSIEDFKTFLLQSYTIGLTSISFRDVVSRYFRIYGRDNLDERHPLRSVPQEREEDAIVSLMKLFSLYENIEHLRIALREAKDKWSIFKKSMQFDFIHKGTVHK